MARIDPANLIGGVLVMGIGGAFAWGATGLPMGGGRVLGPGYFPLATGLLTAGLGLVIALGAVIPGLRPGARGPGQGADAIRLPAMPWRPMVAVLGAIAVFGLLIGRAGLVPAVLAAVAIAALGSPRNRPLAALVLAVATALACWLLFVIALGLPIRAFRNPL